MAIKKIAFATDLHGNHQDKFTVESLFLWLESFQPDICVFGGDLWDFASIRQGASESDRSEDFEKDWIAGEKFITKFFSYGKENHFLLGNHCTRIYTLINHPNALLNAFANQVAKDIDNLAKHCNAKLYPYDSRLGVCRIGDMSYVHGYACNMHAAKSHAEIYGRCVCGHVHRKDYYRCSTYERTEAWTVPCLCDLDPSYASARKAKLAHSNGWAYGFYNTETGKVSNHVVECEGNEFIVATEFKSYSSKD